MFSPEHDALELDTRPRILDLYCGAGGAGMGYFRAGFDVTGVDHRPQPRYPFNFVLADALDYVREHGHEYDAIHASPPCQGYSRMRHLPWLKSIIYPMLIPETRELLSSLNAPWVIENVEDAPLPNSITLCGTQFGLRVFRHRKFESNVLLLAPHHSKHTVVIGAGRFLNDRAEANADGWVSLPSKVRLNKPQDPDGMLSVGGHNFPGGDAAKDAMGIDWMTRDELAQAIPPAYTFFIGKQLILYVKERQTA